MAFPEPQTTAPPALVDEAEGAVRPQTAIFKSLAARKATFLLALIWIASPGCRIAPHARRPLPDLQDAETSNTDSLILLEMLRDQANEVAEQGFTCLFRQLMLLGQDRGKLLERNWTPGFGCGGRCLCFGCRRYDDFPPTSAERATELGK